MIVETTTRIIARVNNVDIMGISEEQLIPIRPLCEALGVAYAPQTTKIKEHYLFGSVVTLSVTTGKDGKQYEMLCLPAGYVLGWLLTINPANVKEEVRDMFASYQAECFKVLYNHFTARSRFVEQKQKEIDRQLSVVEEAKEHFRTAKSVLSDAEDKLKKLRQLTMDDYDMERRQLKIEF